MMKLVQKKLITHQLPGLHSGDPSPQFPSIDQLGIRQNFSLRHEVRFD